MNTFQTLSNAFAGPKSKKPFGWTLFAIYAIGFVTWNIHLGSYGFFEYNLIQLRYLSAGVFFAVLSALVIIFSAASADYYLNKLNTDNSSGRKIVYSGVIVTALFLLFSLLISWVTPIWVLSLLLLVQWFTAVILENRDRNKNRAFVSGTLLFFFFFTVFVRMIFPVVPQYLGGARPLPVLILGTEEQMEFINNFDVPLVLNAKGGSVQTSAVCLIYQNDDYAVFFSASDIKSATTTKNIVSFKTRVLSLSKEAFLGFQAAPRNEYSEMQCNLSQASKL